MARASSGSRSSIRSIEPLMPAAPDRRTRRAFPLRGRRRAQSRARKISRSLHEFLGDSLAPFIQSSERFGLIGAVAPFRDDALQPLFSDYLHELAGGTSKRLGKPNGIGERHHHLLETSRGDQSRRPQQRPLSLSAGRSGRDFGYEVSPSWRAHACGLNHLTSCSPCFRVEPSQGVGT
jgi:hypothetical protein